MITNKHIFALRNVSAYVGSGLNGGLRFCRWNPEKGKYDIVHLRNENGEVLSAADINTFNRVYTLQQFTQAIKALNEI